RIQPLRDRLAAPAAPQHDPLPPREGRAATGPRRLRPSPGHATRAGDVSRARQRDARARQRGRGGRRRPLRHLTARVAVGAYTSSPPPPPPQPVAVDARVASRTPAATACAYGSRARRSRGGRSSALDEPDRRWMGPVGDGERYRGGTDHRGRTHERAAATE